MNKSSLSHTNRIQFIVFLTALLVFAVWSFMFWEYSIDDAFITFKYAENVANGNGFVFQPSDSPVEGYSNLLWLLVLSLLCKIGLPTFLTSKVLGLSCMLLSGFSWFCYYKNDKDSYLWLAGPLFIASPLVIFWGVSGLELGLHSLLLSLMIQQGLRKSRWVYLPALLLVLNRPEGIAIAGAFFCLIALSDFMNKKTDMKYYLYGFISITITLALLVWFRYEVYGYPLPNTYYAKTHYNHHGYKELLNMLIRLAPLTITMLWGIYASLKNRLKNKELTVIVGLFVLQAAVSSSVDPVMNYMFRYLVPFLPLFIIAALYFVSKYNRFKLQYIVICLILISYVAISFELHKLNIQNRQIMKSQQNLINWLNTKKTKTTISMIDMGRIPYYTDHQYNDTWGLVDKEIGHAGFNHIYEFLHLPDYFVFVGTIGEDENIKLRLGRDQMIASIPIFLQCYKLEKVGAPSGVDIHTPGYYYFAFKKNDNAQSIVDSYGKDFWDSKIKR